MNVNKTKKLIVKEVRPLLESGGKETSLYYPKVSAGFPSPAENYFEEKIDLNNELIKHPAATFFVKVEGNSMINAGIFSGDILIVDRSVSPGKESIVVAAVNGELTVKRILQKKRKIYLMPDNPDYSPIEITEDSNLLIWGVVIYNIHKL